MSTKKMVLGWDIDTKNLAIHLTERHHQCLLDVLNNIPQTRKHISVNMWHKVLGELRSMSLALPGSRGLCNAPQVCFKSNKKCIHLTTMVHNFLDIFWWIAGTLHTHPTYICKVVPASPVIVGSTDASGLGMGGTYFIPTSWSTPHPPNYCVYLWHQPYKQWTQDALITFTNPQRTITNSDLELMGTAAHHNVIAAHHGVTELTIGTAHNNNAAIIWNCKGSTSTAGPVAYLL